MRGGTILDGERRVKFLAKTSGNLRIQFLQSSAENFRIVAESRKPVYVRFAAKPSELAFGEAAGGLLDFLQRFFFRKFSGQVGAPLRVADELEGLGVGGNCVFDELGDFFDPTRLNHGVNA